MRLTTKRSAKQIYTVTTDWATYSVVFNESLSQALVYCTGLEEEFDIRYFLPTAKAEAIAGFLVAQLELQSEG